MIKFSNVLTVVAVALISSQSLAAIRLTTLNCGSAKTADGRPILGVGYTVQITSGLDTHARNPDGTIGVPFGPGFQLVSKVVAPGAVGKAQSLTLASMDAQGNYNLVGNGLKAVVKSDLTQAQVLFDNNSTASCN